MRKHGSSFSRKRGITAAYLDLTPVVDVVFNLIIFFALSLNFSPAVRGIKIKVPEVSAAVEEVKAEKIAVSIYKDGRIFLNDGQVSRKGLREALESSPNKSATVVIKAEEKVAHGVVVDLMSLIKSSGYTKLALAANKIQ